MDSIQTYKQLLEKKKSLETELATAQGSLKATEDSFEQFKVGVISSFPGMDTLSKLEAAQAEAVKKIEGDVAVVLEKCPGILG
jgi:hypothetical protein